MVRAAAPDMKCFTCALEAIPFGAAVCETNVPCESTVQLGIPSGQTERIIQVERHQTALCEIADHQKFISLPVLFQLRDKATPNGIVLKAGAVLLTPKIDIELEIPEEDIQKLPETFTGWYLYFRGAYFNDQKLILILDPEKLAENIR